ncbi:MAG: hypothetical protein ACTSVZ_04685 [Promethearchaeota archaeon]
MKTVSIRLNELQDREVEALATRLQVDKSTAARKIIAEGLKILKTQEALDNVRQKRWTVWKGASYCGMSFREFLPLLRRENVSFPLSVEEMELELNENRSEQ